MQQGQRKVMAECRTSGCGKTWHEANAQAVGARHAAAHGHEVVVEVLAYYIYSGDSR